MLWSEMFKLVANLTRIPTEHRESGSENEQTYTYVQGRRKTWCV